MKIKKQMSYANAKQIPYVAMAGEDEINNSMVSLKNMETGEQSSVSIERLLEILR